MNGEERIIAGTLPGGERLDKALSLVSGLSRERVKALLGEGRITLGGKIASQASLKPDAGTTFEICVPEAAPAEAVAQGIPLCVAYEDERSGIGGVVRPGSVHRIDKETSGLLVVAKTDQAHEGLAHQFADHSIHRVYQAVVAGLPIPPAGTVSGHIGRSDHDRKKMAVLHPLNKRGKHAVTHYQLIEPLGAASLVECRLETGRTHQVRVHMASIGHPLLGDPVYGRAPQRLRPILNQLHFARQALHAAELGFIHPVTGVAQSHGSPLPADMAGLLVELRKQS